MKRQGCGWSPFEPDRWTADEVEQYWSEAADEAADDTGGRSSEDEKVATNDDSSDDSWGPCTAADWSETKVDSDDRWTIAKAPFFSVANAFERTDRAMDVFL